MSVPSNSSSVFSIPHCIHVKCGAYFDGRDHDNQTLGIESFVAKGVGNFLDIFFQSNVYSLQQSLLQDLPIVKCTAMQ